MQGVRAAAHRGEGHNRTDWKFSRRHVCLHAVSEPNDSKANCIDRRPYFASPVYNASKAALHAYSDTLRVELSQFDVKVINLVTGGVKSELSRVERTLPPDSYYMPINDEFTRRVKFSQDVGMPTDAFAKRAVDKILGRSLLSQLWAILTLGNSRRWIWEGSKVGQVWFLTRWMPKAFAELIFIRMFNLQKLRGTADKKLL